MLALAGRGGGDHLHDPGVPWPVRLDVPWRLFGLELPAGLASMAFLDIHYCERDRVLSLELATDLPVEAHLVGLDGQQEVGPGPINAPSQSAFPQVPDWDFRACWQCWAGENRLKR